MAPRILVSCVAEDRQPYYARVAMLGVTVRSFGGALAEAPPLANFVASIDPRERSRLEAVGMQVRVVEAMPQRRHSNKLRTLDVEGREDFDILLSLDCDIAVCGDPTPYFRSDAIGVAAADDSPLGDADWEAVLTHFGVASLQRSLTAGVTGLPMYPYFNSGVIAVPRQLCADLQREWIAAIADVADYWRGHPPASGQRFFLDQLALALVLCRKLPWYELDRRVNFPTNKRLHPSVIASLEQPLLLHYHARVNRRGLLRAPADPFARDCAERINTAYADAQRIRYRGLAPTPARALLGNARYRARRFRAAVARLGTTRS